jgi:hypothetical protein
MSWATFQVKMAVGSWYGTLLMSDGEADNTLSNRACIVLQGILDLRSLGGVVAV